MMLSTGLDIIDIARFECEIAKHGDGLLDEVFTPGERAVFDHLRRPASGYAMGYAAKEACFKALGTGKIGRMGWRDLQVRWAPPSQPAIELSGASGELAATMGVRRAHLALASTRDHAVAWVALE
ncbi:MAG: holo-ACP synthase [Acidobacteriota bacterium]